MISAKVDFLQLLVVKATVGRLAVGEHSVLLCYAIPHYLLPHLGALWLHSCQCRA